MSRGEGSGCTQPEYLQHNYNTMAPSFKKSSSDKDKSSEAAATSNNATDDFNARRSARVAANKVDADKDTWVEALAVCEMPVKSGHGDKQSNNDSKKRGSLLSKFKSKSNSGNHQDNDDNDADNNKNKTQVDADVAAASQRLTLRPYFQSQNTGQRVWDEPPSGASNIIYATQEARKMAEAQLSEMRSTYAQAAVQRRQEREEKKELKAALAESKRLLGESSGSGGGGGKLSTVIPKVFKRNSSTSGTDASETQSSSLLGNNKNNKSSSTRPKGTLVLSDEGGRRGIPKSILEESKELSRKNRKKTYDDELQKAMLMSLQVGNGSVMGVGDTTKHRTNSSSKPSPSSSSLRTGSNGSDSPIAPTGIEYFGIEEQIAMAKALSLSEQEARQSCNTKRSKSATYKRTDSGGNSNDKQRSKSQNGHHLGNSTYTSSASQQKANNYANITANMKPTLAEFADDFDGGGKMPAKKKNNDKEKSGQADDFGDRGSSWELEWNCSSPKMHKDSGFC